MTQIKKIAAALSVIVLLAGNSFATTTKTTSTLVTEEPAAELLSVNFVGEDANYLFFHVTVKAGNNKSVWFDVSDKTEGELYSVKFSADKVQTLKIEKRQGQELDFNLVAGDKSFSRSFTIMPTVTLEKL
jgi:hypothetical protein